MKRVVSVVLLLTMILSLSACGAGSNGIKLTLDNYDDYLSVEGYVSGSDVFQRKYNGYYIPEYRTLKAVGSVEPLSQNFNYNNVKITIRVYGTYTQANISAYGGYDPDTETTKEYSVTVDLYLDISGNLKDNEGTVIVTSINKLAMEYTNNYQIVEISGTITPA